MIKGNNYIVDVLEQGVDKRPKLLSQYDISPFTKKVTRRQNVPQSLPRGDTNKWKVFEIEWRRIMPEYIFYDYSKVRYAYSSILFLTFFSISFLKLVTR